MSKEDVQTILRCAAGRAGPTKEQVLAALARVLGDDDVLVAAARGAKDKATLCTFIEFAASVNPVLRAAPSPKVGAVLLSPSVRENKMVPVTPPTVGVEECARQLLKYDLKETLGAGSFGRVVTGCESGTKNCSYAIKVQALDATFVNRELYFLNYLQKVRLPHSGSAVVPTLVDAWSCPTRQGTMTQYIVLDKWDGNMETVHGEGAGFYYVDELLTMFQLARTVGEAGVIHGDLRPDNFLRRKQHIVMTDFAFAGFPNPRTKKEGEEEFMFAMTGWSANFQGPWDCPAGITPIPSCDAARRNKAPKAKGGASSPWRWSVRGCDTTEASTYAAMLNVVQLESFFVAFPVRVYKKPVPEGEEPESLGLFAGVTSVPMREYFLCPKYDATKAAKEAEWAATEQLLFHLAWTALL